MGDPGPVIASVAFFVTILASIVLIGPIGRAFAERLRGRNPDAELKSEEVEALREELDGLRRQVSELAERQDFSERVLAQARDQRRLPAAKQP